MEFQRFTYLELPDGAADRLGIPGLTLRPVSLPLSSLSFFAFALAPSALPRRPRLSHRWLRTFLVTPFRRRARRERTDDSSFLALPLHGGKTLSPHPSRSLRLTVAADNRDDNSQRRRRRRRRTTIYVDVIATTASRRGDTVAARVNVSGCTTVRRRRLFSFDGTRKTWHERNEQSCCCCYCGCCTFTRLWRAAGRAGLRASTLVNPV